jgi:predicted metalloprotease with PDZ domain
VTPLLLAWALLFGGLPSFPAARGATAAPLIYTLRVPAPESHRAEVEVLVPTEGRATVELMMATWSPGYYRVADHARQVQSFSAQTEDGRPLALVQPAPNRWRIETGGARSVRVSYTLLCEGNTVVDNTVLPEYGLFNGPATFVTLAEKGPRPAEIRLELPAAWPASASSLDPAPGGLPNRYLAPNFDVLADSPLAAGTLRIHELKVGGSLHQLVDFGHESLLGGWDGAAALRKLRPIVEEHRRFMGRLPFHKYAFLNLFRNGRGGLEHLNSTLLTSTDGKPPSLRWLHYVSHEYFHAFNVKRLRPVELGPFDYERPPSTTSLWFSEGVTSYFAELAVVRAGVSTPEEFLRSLSNPIRALQTAPGRRIQTLNASSLEVWTNSTSGIGVDAAHLVSYYDKGHVLGFLLEARIQRATGGSKTFGDAFLLAYRRYSGAKGFTAAELEATISEVAGTDLRAFFHHALETTEELDYGEALDWFGLRFAVTHQAGSGKTGGAPPASGAAQGAGKAASLEPWTLEVRPDATAQQRRRLERWLRRSVPSP